MLSADEAPLWRCSLGLVFMSIAVKVSGLNKSYRLYQQPLDRLKEAFHPFGKKYSREFSALSDIDFSVSHGLCLGIIGMNGGGKSTLLKILAGVVTPTSGGVSLNGKVSALLELGAGFNPELSGLENARFQCSLQGFDSRKIEDILPNILDFAEIGDFIHQPVKTYSSGMYVRLAFSVAISVEPDILIVDEALSVGDAYFQAKCIQRIRQFRQFGKTIIFVSHDSAAVKTLCDEAILLHQGRLIDRGSPDRVFDLYNGIIADQDLLAKQDKESSRMKSGNGKVSICQVRLLGENGLEIEACDSGGLVKFLVDIVLNEEVEDLTVGILIRDRLGNDIFGTNTAIQEFKLPSIEVGQHIVVEFGMELNLGPNSYNVSVAAHAGKTHLEQSFDWVNHACIFKVLPKAPHTFVGCCNLPCDVSFSLPDNKHLAFNTSNLTSGVEV